MADVFSGIFHWSGASGEPHIVGYNVNYSDQNGKPVPYTAVAFDRNAAAIGDKQGRILLLHFRRDTIFSRVDFFKIYTSTPHQVVASPEGNLGPKPRITRNNCPITRLCFSEEDETYEQQLYAASGSLLMMLPKCPSPADATGIKLIGHNETISSIKWLAPSWLVSCSPDKMILWKTPLLQKVKVLSGPQRRINAAVPFSIARTHRFFLTSLNQDLVLWNSRWEALDVVRQGVWCLNDEIRKNVHEDFHFNLLEAESEHYGQRGTFIAASGIAKTNNKVCGSVLLTAYYTMDTKDPLFTTAVQEGPSQELPGTTGPIIRFFRVGTSGDKVVTDLKMIRTRSLTTSLPPSREGATHLVTLASDGTIDIRCIYYIGVCLLRLYPKDLLPPIDPHIGDVYALDFSHDCKMLLLLAPRGNLVYMNADFTIRLGKHQRERREAPAITLPVMGQGTTRNNNKYITLYGRASIASELLKEEDEEPEEEEQQEYKVTPTDVEPANMPPLPNIPSPLEHVKGHLRKIVMEVPAIRLPCNLFFLYTHPSTEGTDWRLPATMIRNYLPPEMRSELTGESNVESLTFHDIRKSFLTKPPWAFPETVRADLWTALLALPRQQSALDALLETLKGTKGIDFYYRKEIAKMPEANKWVKDKMTKLLSYLAAWSPHLREIPWLPSLVRPIIKAYGKRQLFCFETTLAILLWWGYAGCRAFSCGPKGPVNLQEEGFATPRSSGSFMSSSDDETLSSDFEATNIVQDDLAGWYWFDTPGGGSPPHLVAFASFVLAREDPPLWAHIVKIAQIESGLRKKKEPVVGFLVEKIHLRFGHRIMWPLIRSLLSNALSDTRVRKLWDHFFARPTRTLLPVAAAVAFLITIRVPLFDQQNFDGFLSYIISHPPFSFLKLIDRMNNIDNRISSDWFPLLATLGLSSNKRLLLGRKVNVAVTLNNLGWPVWHRCYAGPPSDAPNLLPGDTYPCLFVDRTREENRTAARLQIRDRESKVRLAALRRDIQAALAADRMEDSEKLLDRLTEHEKNLRTELALLNFTYEDPQTTTGWGIDEWVYKLKQEDYLLKQIYVREKLIVLMQEALELMPRRQPSVEDKRPDERAQLPSSEEESYSHETDELVEATTLLARMPIIPSNRQELVARVQSRILTEEVRALREGLLIRDFSDSSEALRVIEELEGEDIMEDMGRPPPPPPKPQGRRLQWDKILAAAAEDRNVDEAPRAKEPPPAPKQGPRKLMFRPPPVSSISEPTSQTTSPLPSMFRSSSSPGLDESESEDHYTRQSSEISVYARRWSLGDTDPHGLLRISGMPLASFSSGPLLSSATPVSRDMTAKLRVMEIARRSEGELKTLANRLLSVTKVEQDEEFIAVLVDTLQRLETCEQDEGEGEALRSLIRSSLAQRTVPQMAIEEFVTTMDPKVLEPWASALVENSSSTGSISQRDLLLRRQMLVALRAGRKLVDRRS